MKIIIYKIIQSKKFRKVLKKSQMHISDSNKLHSEVEKLTGIMTPKEIRVVAKEVASLIPNYDFPIKIRDNKLVILISMIFESQKFEKVQESFFPTLYECILGRTFGGEALLQITSLFCRKIEKICWKESRKLNQFLGKNILDNFPDIYLIFSCFSISLSIMNHSDLNISGTSYVTFQKILDELVNRIQMKEECPKDFIRFCTCNYGLMDGTFKNNLNCILFMLFNELSCIIINQPLKLLKISSIKESLMFDIFETIFSSYSAVFTECPQLASVFEGTVILSLHKKNALSFIATFVQTCSHSHASLCFSIFNEYIPLLNEFNENLSDILYLFHAFVLKNPNDIIDFIEATNGTELLTSLIDKIKVLIVDQKPKEPLDFSLKAINNNRIKNIKHFKIISPYEICLGIINSFYKSQKIKIKDLFENSKNDFYDIIKYSLRFSSFSSFYLVTNGFYQLFSINYMLEIQNYPFGLLVNFDQFCDTKEMTQSERIIFDISDKNHDWNNFIIKLISISPDICHGQWDYIFGSIFGNNEEVNLSPSFASHFNDEVIEEITNALIMSRPFPTQFVVDFIISNITRFDIIWNILSQFFICEIKYKRLEKDIFELVLDLMRKAFIDITENGLLDLSSKILPSLNIENKRKLLSQIRQILNQSPEILKGGWKYILVILNPSFFICDEKLLSSAFSIFNLICDNCINNATQEDIHKSIELAIEYAKQKELINISLSSFNTLWDITEHMESTNENWMFVFLNILEYWNDPRSDVGQCAIKIFFAISSSNFENIKKLKPTPFNYFIESGFKEAILKFEPKNQQTNFIFHTVLYETSHFLLNFLDDFECDCYELFVLIIKKHEEMMIFCSNQNTSITSLQFYDGFYSSSKLTLKIHNLLIQSFYNLINKKYILIENINSVLTSQFARILAFSFLATVKDKIGIIPIDGWCDLFYYISLNFKHSNMINVGTQRVLESFKKAFPLPLNESVKIFSVMISIFCDCSFIELKKKIISYLISISEYTVYKSYLFLSCENITNSVESYPLFSKLIQMKFSFEENQKSQALEICKKLSNNINEIDSNVLDNFIQKINDSNQK